MAPDDKFWQTERHMTRELIEAYRFHRANSGYIVGQHAVSAIRLARAELAARNLGWRVEWYHEEDDIDLGDHEFWCSNARGADGGHTYPCEHEALYARLVDENGELLESLGMILDPSPSYRRTVEAELALEALPDPIPSAALYACVA